MKIPHIFLLSLILLSACAAPGSSPIEIKDAWVRLAPDMGDMGRNAALYLLIENHAAAADELLRVETSAAHMAQMHLTEVDANGVASMREIASVEVPAGGSLELKPGGYHVMLMGLGDGLQEGSTASFTLVFKNAGVIEVEAPLRSP
jgi:copper(I)-binding protein